MAQTYTSTTYTVDDGDTVTHTTSEDIAIQSAQCRWKGESDFRTTKTVVSSLDSTQQGGPVQAGDSAAVSMPSEPNTSDEFYQHEYGASLNTNSNSDSGSVTFNWEYRESSGGAVLSSGTDSITIGTSTTFERSYFGSTETQNQDGEMSVEVDSASGDTSNMSIRAEAKTDGYDNDTTETETEDPSVSVNNGAGSASVSGTLNDGSWSNWVTMTGMSEGTNTFDQSINGSGEAKWEFEYTYEITLPEAKSYKKVQGPNGEIDIILAPPSDGDLKWNGRRIAVDHDQDGTVEILALDVVDPSHQDASELRFEGPNQTWAYRDDPTT